MPISVSKSVFLKIVGVLVIANNKATIKLFHNQGTLIIIRIITIIITWAGVGALLIDMFCMKVAMMSTGTGNTIVLLFSAEMLFSV